MACFNGDIYIVIAVRTLIFRLLNTVFCACWNCLNIKQSFIHAVSWIECSCFCTAIIAVNFFNSVLTTWSCLENLPINRVLILIAVCLRVNGNNCLTFVFALWAYCDTNTCLLTSGSNKYSGIAYIFMCSFVNGNSLINIFRTKSTLVENLTFGFTGSIFTADLYASIEMRRDFFCNCLLTFVAVVCLAACWVASGLS